MHIVEVFGVHWLSFLIRGQVIQYLPPALQHAAAIPSREFCMARQQFNGGYSRPRSGVYPASISRGTPEPAGHKRIPAYESNSRPPWIIHTFTFPPLAEKSRLRAFRPGEFIRTGIFPLVRQFVRHRENGRYFWPDGRNRSVHHNEAPSCPE